MRLNKCELLDGEELTMCGRLWCDTHHASICGASASADARVIGSVMKVKNKIIVRRVRLVVSCDDTTEECGMGYECFSSTLDCLLYLN
jgi:hypothetical protein